MKLNPFPFWRRQYLARYEQYLESYPPEVALDYAGRSISGCAIFNIASLPLLLIAATGGIVIPEELLVGLLIVISLVGSMWLMSYIQVGEELEELWDTFRAQPEEEKARRRRELRLYTWGSVLVVSVSIGLCILRAIHSYAQQSV